MKPNKNNKNDANKKKSDHRRGVNRHTHRSRSSVAYVDRIFELMHALGMSSISDTVDWLMQQAQPAIVAAIGSGTMPAVRIITSAPVTNNAVHTSAAPAVPPPVALAYAVPPPVASEPAPAWVPRIAHPYKSCALEARVGYRYHRQLPRLVSKRKFARNLKGRTLKQQGATGVGEDESSAQEIEFGSTSTQPPPSVAVPGLENGYIVMPDGSIWTNGTLVTDSLGNRCMMLSDGRWWVNGVPVTNSPYNSYMVLPNGSRWFFGDQPMPIYNVSDVLSNYIALATPPPPASSTPAHAAQRTEGGAYFQASPPPGIRDKNGDIGDLGSDLGMRRDENQDQESDSDDDESPKDSP